MHHMHRRAIFAWILVAVALAVNAAPALAAGGGTLNNSQETYTNGWTEMPSDGVIASVTVQFVGYELNAVAGKYKLIPVLLRTGARPAPLTLAPDEDRLVVMSGGRKVAASFRLSALDRTLWDSLPPEMKKRLTYPEQVSPESAVMVYAFVPLAELTGPLEGFEYTIRSLPAPLLLLPEPNKKAAALSHTVNG